MKFATSENILKDDETPANANDKLERVACPIVGSLLGSKINPHRICGHSFGQDFNPSSFATLGS